MGVLIKQNSEDLNKVSGSLNFIVNFVILGTTSQYWPGNFSHHSEQISF